MDAGRAGGFGRGGSSPVPAPEALSLPAFPPHMAHEPNGPGDAFAAITDCTARLMGGDAALVWIDAPHRDWFTAQCGPLPKAAAGVPALCARAFGAGPALIVPDAAEDARLKADPMVRAADGVRFLASVPLTSRRADADQVIGTLCVIGQEPRLPSTSELKMFRQLGHLVETLIDARRTAAEHRVAAETAERRLREREQGLGTFEQAERLASVGSWRLDLGSAELTWSPHSYTLFGLDPAKGPPALEELFGFYPVQDRDLIMQAIDRAIATGAAYDVETDIVTGRGERRRVRNVGEVECRDGEAVALIGICQDVTSRYDFEKALERSARYDELTQLPNRSALDAYLHEHVERNRMADRALAVLLIDLDNFKTANDTYGHAAGDEVLKAIGAKLAAQAEALGFAARLGGDEFVLAITDAEALAAIRPLLHRLLGELVVAVPGPKGAIRVAATIGCCVLTDGIHSKSELLKRADLALYSAKALGKGRAIVSGDLRPISADDDSVDPTQRHEVPHD